MAGSSSFRYLNRLSDIYDKTSAFPVEDPASAYENHDRETEDILSSIVSSTSGISVITANVAALQASQAATAASLAALTTSFNALNATLTAAWTSYGPSCVQGLTVNVTNIRAVYIQIGKTVHVDVNLTVTGTGSSGSPIAIGLPVTAIANTKLVGNGLVHDSSTATDYWANSFADSTTTVGLYDTVTSHQIGVDPAFALANGDTLRFHGFYESA